MKTIVLSLACLLTLPFVGCESLNPTVAKVNAWNQSDSGKLVLDKVKTAASAFGPQYAGVIGLGIDSLESGGAGAVPDPTAMQQTLASVTGNSANAAKILALAEAVDAVAHSAPTPNAGLNAAAATINAQAAQKIASTANRKAYVKAQTPAVIKPVFRIGCSALDFPNIEPGTLIYPNAHFVPALLNLEFQPGKLPVITYANR